MEREAQPGGPLARGGQHPLTTAQRFSLEHRAYLLEGNSEAPWLAVPARGTAAATCCWSGAGAALTSWAQHMQTLVSLPLAVPSGGGRG